MNRLVANTGLPPPPPSSSHGGMTHGALSMCGKVGKGKRATTTGRSPPDWVLCCAKSLTKADRIKQTTTNDAPRAAVGTPHQATH